MKKSEMVSLKVQVLGLACSIVGVYGAASSYTKTNKKPVAKQVISTAEELWNWASSAKE